MLGPRGKVSLFLLKPARTGAGTAAASMFSEGKAQCLTDGMPFGICLFLPIVFFLLIFTLTF